MLRLGGQFKCGAEAANSYRNVLLHGAGEIMGGLAQALGQLPPSLPNLGLSGSSSDENGPSPYADLPPFSGLAVVQLKRALRGAAFALGALYPLRMSEALDQAAYDELRRHGRASPNRHRRRACPPAPAAGGRNLIQKCRPHRTCADGEAGRIANTGKRKPSTRACLSRGRRWLRIDLGNMRRLGNLIHHPDEPGGGFVARWFSSSRPT